MSHSHAVLQSSDPEMLGQHFKAMVMSLKIWHRLLVDSLEEERLYFVANIEDLVMLQSADSANFLVFLLVVGYDQLIYD